MIFVDQYFPLREHAVFICSVHKELNEGERFFHLDFRGIDLVGVQKIYL